MRLVAVLGAGSVAAQERVGSSGDGPLNCVFVALALLEVQSWGGHSTPFPGAHLFDVGSLVVLDESA